MFLARLCSLMLLVLLAGARPAGAAQTKAFVLTSDFMTGSLSAVNLDNRAVSQDVVTAGLVCSDARMRWYGGLLYIVNRLGCDNILVLDPSNGYSVVRQFSVGNGSNPADIVFLSPGKAYVSRYELATILIVNPSTGGTLGQISLAPFADADNIPEMDHMARVGDRVFVTVQRLDRHNGFVPADSSLVVVINAVADTVLDANPALTGVQAIRLPGEDPVTDLVFDRATARLLVGCVGRFNLLDGGIAWVDPFDLRSDGYAITEKALGGNVGDLAWRDSTHSYAIVSDASFNSSLVSWRESDGTRIATVFSPGGFSLPDCELNDRGELYVCDNDFLAPGLFVFSTPNDQPIAGPLDTGLPPVQVTFDGVSNITAVPSPSSRLAFSGPWPNPANRAARFALSLARAGWVRVEAFDLAGRHVRTLTLGDAPAGINEVMWDLQDQSNQRVRPGVYLIRATTGDISVVRRITVLY